MWFYIKKTTQFDKEMWNSIYCEGLLSTARKIFHLSSNAQSPVLSVHCEFNIRIEFLLVLLKNCF